VNSIKFLSIVTASFIFGGAVLAEKKLYTTYRDGEKVTESTVPPKKMGDDFYVKSLGIRIQNMPGAKESPYRAIKNACEDKGSKDGLSCYYLGAYHEERGQKKLALQYYGLSCKSKYKDSCDKVAAK